MWDFLGKLYDSSGFKPRAVSEGWYPELMWLHNISDALIFVAYLAIPGVLVYFVRRRRDVPFRHVFWLFGAFIISCGFTHFLEVHSFYYFPMYHLSGFLKAVTAVLSWCTVLALIPVTPRALSMRFPEELEREIAERQRAQERLQRSETALRKHTRVLRSILDSMSDGVVVADESGLILLTNPAAKRLLGSHTDSILFEFEPASYGAFLPDTVTPYPSNDLPLARAIRGETVNRAEVFVRHSGAPQGLWLSVNGRPLKDELEIVKGGVIVLRDITEHKRAEDEIRRKQQQLMDAQKLARLGSWEWDVTTNRVLWSDELYRLFGREPQEFDTTFKALIEQVHCDDRQSLTDVIETAYRKGQPFQNDVRVTGADGAIRTLHTRGQVLADKNGRPVRLLGTCQDVTETRKQEESIRQSQKLLARAQQIAHVGSWEWDLANDTIAWSDELYRIYGLERKQFDGTYKAFMARVHPDDRDRVQDLVEAARRDRTSFQFDERIIRRDGAVRTLHSQGEVATDEHGRVVRMIGTCQDVTEAKQREAALRESEERFRLLIEGVKGYAIIMLDSRGHVVSWNTGAERIKGYRPDEIIGQHYSRFYRSEDIQDGRPSRHLNEAACEGKCESEGWRVRKDGSLFWASTLLAALRDEDGQLRGFAKITRDTTELKEAHERALRAERLAAIGEMIAGLAHESRNALQRTQACLERLAWKVEDRPDAAELVARMRQAQRDLHHTFEEVRQYAAPVNLNRDPCHLGELLEETWEELAEMRGARQARLDTHVENCDLHCAVDAFTIKQVLRNTLENSLLACPDPLEIHVCFSGADLDGVAALQLRIRDNGPGLTVEQQCRIFEPFYTTKTRGTGLGMAIAKRVVEAHGGTIAAASNNSRGAEIRITLPRRRS